MKIKNLSLGSRLMMAGCLFATAASTGCQSTVGGQTLPSAYYLRDDVQFFPAGSEELLPNQKKALDEYAASQVAGGN